LLVRYYSDSIMQRGFLFLTHYVCVHACVQSCVRVVYVPVIYKGSSQYSFFRFPITVAVRFMLHAGYFTNLVSVNPCTQDGYCLLLLSYTAIVSVMGW